MRAGTKPELTSFANIFNILTDEHTKKILILFQVFILIYTACRISEFSPPCIVFANSILPFWLFCLIHCPIKTSSKTRLCYLNTFWAFKKLCFLLWHDVLPSFLQELLLYYTFLLFFTIKRPENLSNAPEQQKINFPPEGINYVQRFLPARSVTPK